MSEPKYPEVEVVLLGEDGNAFAIMGAVNRALRQYGIEPAECEEFIAEAKSADYDHLLVTCMKWVTVL
jgi:hypothetical protein